VQNTLTSLQDLIKVVVANNELVSQCLPIQVARNRILYQLHSAPCPLGRGIGLFQGGRLHGREEERVGYLVLELQAQIG
jgi:hypothetical protein